MQQPARQASYGCTALKGTGKAGVLKPDTDGYYTLMLGAYGVYNSAGMFYDLASARQFFQPRSPLMRMLEKGVLKAEFKHPEPDLNIRDPEMRQQAFIQRIRQIDDDRVCAHVRNVRLEEHRDKHGRPYIAVVGEVRPSGPKGQYLKERLENPHENVYFSVRSLTMDDVRRGVKYTREIVTWDLVNEGGIETANKYASPGLEGYEDSALQSLQEITVSPQALWSLADQQHQGQDLGLESGHADYDALIEELGWNYRRTSHPAAPRYTQW